MSQQVPEQNVGISQAILKGLGGWAMTFLLAILTLFSDRISNSIKFGLNKAESRSKQYESFCTEISNFIFCAELAVEFCGSPSTRRETLETTMTEYNTAITELRKNEYVYLAWLYRFWDEDHVREFQAIMKLVKSIDTELHGLNEELGGVVLDKSRPRLNPEVALPIVNRIRPVLKDLQSKADRFLQRLR